MQNVNALLGVLHEFEAEFKQEKQEFMEKFHQDMTTEMKSMPRKFKAPLHSLLDAQMNVWSSRMMIKFKLALSQVLVSFVNNNADVNGYANDASPHVVEMLTNNLVTNPENNLTKALMGTEEDGHFSDGLQLQSPTQSSDKEKIHKKKSPKQHRDRKATKHSLLTNQASTSSNSNSNNEIIKANNKRDIILLSSDSEECTEVAVIDKGSSRHAKKAKLDTSVSQPVRDVMVIRLGLECFKLDCQQMFATTKQLNAHMWTEHRIRASPCPVKDCGQSFDDIIIRFKHIEKDHHKTSVWHCAKCPEEFSQYGHLSNHYLNNHIDQYQCAFVNCAFKSGLEDIVTDHYINTRSHLTCGHPDCGLQFINFSCLAQHERVLHPFKPIHQ